MGLADDQMDATRTVDAALGRLADHRDRAHFQGAVGAEVVERAEAALEQRFPPSWSRFLTQQGAGRFGDQTFFGLTEASGGPPALDAVRQTVAMRQETGLPHNYILVAPLGDNAFYAIDCANRDDRDECPVTELPRDYRKVQEPNVVADDFGAFLGQRIDAELDRR